LAERTVWSFGLTLPLFRPKNIDCRPQCPRLAFARISVFVFQEWSLPPRLDENSFAPKKLSFSMETWSQGGLRYFVIGDASPADINSLAKLFRTAAS
jgi:hypothetical protein